MKDETKRKLIHFLNRFDSLTGRSRRTKGWNSTKLMYDKYDDAVELREMTGKELNRELRTQLLLALPIFLFYILVIGAAIWFLWR